MEAQDVGGVVGVGEVLLVGIAAGSEVQFLKSLVDKHLRQHVYVKLSGRMPGEQRVVPDQIEVELVLIADVDMDGSEKVSDLQNRNMKKPGLVHQFHLEWSFQRVVCERFVAMHCSQAEVVAGEEVAEDRFELRGGGEPAKLHLAKFLEDLEAFPVVGLAQRIRLDLSKAEQRSAFPGQHGARFEARVGEPIEGSARGQIAKFQHLLGELGPQCQYRLEGKLAPMLRVAHPGLVFRLRFSPPTSLPVSWETARQRTPHNSELLE